MPLRSPYPDVQIPPTPLTETILQGVDAVRDHVALIDGATGRSYTYGDFATCVRNASAALARRGIGKHDRVAILSPNLPEYCIAVHAILSVGAVVTTISPLYTEQEIAHQLEDSLARCIITVPQLLDRVQAVAARVRLDHTFVFGEAEGCESFESLMAEEGDWPQVDIAPGDVAAMLYSSGTTGVPKGVMLTHRNLVAALAQARDVFGEGAQRSLLFLPLFHVYGFHAIANFDLAQRSTLVTMGRFDLEQFLGMIQRHKIERVCVVPPIVLALVKNPLVDKYDLSSLRLIFSGAAPLDAELAAACEARLGCPVRQGWGMTETSPVGCGHPIGGDKVKHGSVGLLCPNTEARIVDIGTGEEVVDGEPGELLLRGPQVMLGYFNKPDATRDTLLPGGWLRTGDIARQDEDGWLYIVDRAKELIKYKGLQVAPAELEAVLLTHPAVADAAVIGVADEEAGEVPKAFVVLKGEATPEELQAYVAGRVAPYKKIRWVEFLDRIPKSPSGKILRRLLKERGR